MGAIRIPKKNNHPFVGDNLTRYYHIPFIRRFFLRRLTMALDFLDGRRFDSILEVGFGSGVLLPELSRRTGRLFGLDIHDSVDKVGKMLRNEGVNAALTKGDVVRLPYKDDSFDCVISVATLEHIERLREAVSEIKRILKRNGVAVLGFPVENKVSDFLLVLTGSQRVYKRALKEIHPNDHGAIVSEVKAQFGNIRVKKFPIFLPLDLCLYCGCASEKVN